MGSSLRVPALLSTACCECPISHFFSGPILDSIPILSSKEVLFKAFLKPSWTLLRVYLQLVLRVLSSRAIESKESLWVRTFVLEILTKLANYGTGGPLLMFPLGPPTYVSVYPYEFATSPSVITSPF
jgi:hypothetical protein